MVGVIGLLCQIDTMPVEQELFQEEIEEIEEIIIEPETIVIEIPEVIPVVKKREFNEVSGTNNRLEDLDNMRNLAYFDGDLYTAEVSSTSFDIYKETSITDAASGAPEHSYDITPVAGTNRMSFPVIRIVYIGAKWYLCAMVTARTDNGGVDAGNIYSIFKNLTDGGAWIDDEILAIDADTEEETYQIMDIFSFGTNLDFIWTNDFQDTINYGNVAIATGALTNSGVFITDCPSGIRTYSGNYNGTNYKFLYKDVANDYFVATVPATFVETEEEITITLSTVDNRVQQYWDFGNIEIIMDWKFYYVRVGGSSGTWVPFTDVGGTTTNGIVLGYDSNNLLIIKYVIWQDTIYIVNNQGFPLVFQSFTDGAFVGWEDWFANGIDKIYQLVWVVA